MHDLIKNEEGVVDCFNPPPPAGFLARRVCLAPFVALHDTSGLARCQFQFQLLPVESPVNNLAELNSATYPLS
jgi:hypothetical protein